MNIGYQEKRIGINLTTQLVVYAIYFFALWRDRVTPATLITVIVAIITLQVVLQTVLAITVRSEPRDERDIAIDRTAYRNAYNILVGAILVCLALLTIPTFNPTLAYEFRLSPFHVINVLLFVLLLAELGKLVSQLTLYRKSA